MISGTDVSQGISGAVSKRSSAAAHVVVSVQREVKVSSGINRQQHARRNAGVHVRRRATASLAAGYGVAAVMLLTALALAALVPNGRMTLVIPVSLVGACALAVAAWLILAPNSVAGRQKAKGLRKNLLAQLTPVLCLSAAFPLAAVRLGTARTDSVPTVALILAGSLATPWLSQVVCMPLFTALSSLPAQDQLTSSWLSRWPFVAVASMPVAGIFGAGIGLALGWNGAAIGALILLCVLNSLFSQSLVVGILQRNYLPWAAAWFGFALMVALFPTFWFLPPIAGLLTQLVYLVGKHPPLLRLCATHRMLSQFAKGTLIGAVLWSDKLFFFLRSPQDFQARYVFLAVLPAIVAYGYYFVRLAPSLDEIVADMRATMERDVLAHSAPRLRQLAERVEESIVKVACVGAMLCLLAVVIVILIAPPVSMLFAAMAVASTSFLIITVLLYKLDYVGRTDLVYGFAGIHLAVVAAVILIGPPGPETYMVLAGLSAVVAIIATRSVLTVWRLPEYSLFWRHAAEW
jgi:hypothetical protein